MESFSPAIIKYLSQYYPFESEKRVLNKYNRIDALIVVDLKREGELEEVKIKIERMSNNS